MKRSPDEILSDQIIKAITKINIISENTLEKYRDFIVKGQMTSEDWVLMAESDDEKMKDKEDAQKS